jgi:hypothetical protein
MPARYQPADAAGWDDCVAIGGVPLQSRRFLDYHGDRFEDASLVWRSAAGRIAAVLPAARHPRMTEVVASHPGATYGGLVGDASLGEAELIALVPGLIEHYRASGFGRLVYKPVPWHLARRPADGVIWALMRAGAHAVPHMLWNVIELNSDRRPSELRRRGLRKAERAGLTVAVALADTDYAAFHAILADNLRARHGVEPVHSLDELLDLRQRLGGDAALWLARDPGHAIVGGSWVFRCGTRAWHTQYIAASDAGREAHALDLLLESIARGATAAGVRHLSFGASTEPSDGRLNEGLFRFKSGFGEGAVLHLHYEVEL